MSLDHPFCTPLYWGFKRKQLWTLFSELPTLLSQVFSTLKTSVRIRKKKNRKSSFGYNYDSHCKTANYNRALIPCFVESSAIHVCTAHKLACINNDIKTLLMLWPRTQCLMPVIRTQSHTGGDAVHKLLIAAHVLVSNITMSPISWAKAVKQYCRICRLISASMPCSQAVSANHLHCW